MIEKIEYGGQTFALILRGNYEPEGVTFFTAQENPVQLGILKHRQGTRVKPHLHRNLPRTISETQEVLHLEYGEVEARFYDSHGKGLGSVILKAGDTILLLYGGHGFNILKDSKILEIKQGPYYGLEGDKERFNTEQESGE